MKITIQMIREATERYYCSAKIISFCKMHKLNIQDLLNEGIEEDLILATEDAIAKKIVEEVKSWVEKASHR